MANMEMTLQDKWLIARFREPQRIVSWAVVGGGWTKSRAVAWHQITNADLKPDIDPEKFLRKRLEQISLADAVGFLTSAPLERYSDVEKAGGDFRVRAIATVGLSNALRIGDSPSVRISSRASESFPLPVGTINILCCLSTPLTEEAQLEALSLAAEARTTAVLNAEIPSRESGKLATGTGTDCIAIAAPIISNAAAPLKYSGKHTPLGHLLGASVLEAVTAGIELWKQARSLDKTLT
jgi:adenosylcobinamide amidohydrolase